MNGHPDLARFQAAWRRLPTNTHASSLTPPAPTPPAAQAATASHALGSRPTARSFLTTAKRYSQTLTWFKAHVRITLINALTDRRPRFGLVKERVLAMQHG
ncbi:MAG: hypothetical protein MSG64_15000 [Pyrinomonadaceae bacterium MAG19_C2-C3]|nr:hypothetical protein [Pyrinomonadaceae bacterium MAG19_C2-C3]